MLNIYNIETSNYVNGNGCRYVIWVQGCTFACGGCWNHPTWSFDNNILKNIEELFNEIKILEDKLDGVTFTGGEPFLQAGELSRLAKLIKENTTLDIQIFSGFYKYELIKEEQQTLLKYTDTLVAGRYDNTKENNNQIVYHFNKEVDIWDFNNSDVEIDIDLDGNIKMTGYPTNSLINDVRGESNAGI
jgi:anaerobic ribonucleoside-triphosphate reductase activating protein